MNTRFKFVLCIIITLLIMVIIGCLLYQCDVKIRIKTEVDEVDNDRTTHITDTIEQAEKDEDIKDITVDTETDKDGDISQAEKPIKDKPIFYLTDHERWVVECMVMGESGGEPYEGHVLVAQCILNACLQDKIQPSEVKSNYKYSGWKENPTKSVKKAVSAVFDLGEKIVDEPILYFYAPSLCQSKWHETQIFVIELGGHRFFKEKKYEE